MPDRLPCFLRGMLRRLMLCLALGSAAEAAGAGQQVGLAEVDGPIGPATAEYLARAAAESAKRGDECLVVRLDTPGGLLDSTKKIVQGFYAAPLPVVVYVAPAGAGATSAGCFITLAADVAAMAPATSIGAAHPVALGGGEAKDDGVMKEKIENYAAGSIEAIAKKRGRNAEWAVEAVRRSANITADEALKIGVVDLVAKDLPDLLAQLEGRKVGERTLRTAGASVAPIPMSLRETVFQSLWRPEVMFILMLVAVYGIIGELGNPGAILPGVAGAVALILALYMGAVLPVNAAGVALLLLALALFAVDVFAPTHGILTVGGAVAFALGAFMLFDGSGGAWRLSWTLILPSAALTAAFFAFVAGAGLRAQWRPARTGREALIGRTVLAATPVDAAGGSVWLDGESWRATCDEPVEAGASVEVAGIDGLTLHVKRKQGKDTP